MGSSVHIFGGVGIGPYGCQVSGWLYVSAQIHKWTENVHVYIHIQCSYYF